MSDSTQHLDTISASQAAKETTANQNFDALSPSSLFGRHATETSGLTWGYYGGKFRRENGTIASIANGTITLTNNATNYLYANGDGVVTKVTSAPSGWPGPLVFGSPAEDGIALYQITTSGGLVTNYTDYRTTDYGRSGSGSGSVSDGDKGDITVTGSGGTWTIDNDVVTYAKMQNVSATSRILGRKTGGAGDPEEMTFSEVLDFVGSAAQGDILYRGAATWTRLAAGTSGQFLKTQGAGANPMWDTAGSGSPGGSDTQIQFNDGGSFGGDTALTWDKTNNILYVGVNSAGTPGTGTIQAPTGTNSTTAGTALTIKAGTGGSDGSAGTTGGAIEVRGGAGGAGTSAGAGGAATFQGGEATGSSAAGGAVTVKGGTATGSAVGGVVTIEGGTSANSGATKAAALNLKGGVATGGSSGDVNISTQNATGTNRTAGDVNITVGTSTNGIVGGSINATAGTGGATNGVGGVSTWKGGSGQGSGRGGSSVVQGGTGGATNAQGGSVLLKGGTGGGSGALGQVAVDNGGALATTATGGFFCLPTCAGAPTGVPANVPTGSVAMIFDTTNTKLWVYSGGAWVGVVLA